MLLSTPCRENSYHIKSDDLAGHSINPLLISYLLNWAFRYSRSQAELRLVENLEYPLIPGYFQIHSLNL